MKSINELVSSGFIKKIKGYENHFASMDGKIYSDLSGSLKEIKQTRVNRNLKYLRVTLGSGSKRKNHRVHAVILETFVSLRQKGFHASHIDGNPANNNVTNLLWETARENNLRKRDHGTMARGERHGIAKLTSDDVLKIRRFLARGFSSRKVASLFDMSQNAIMNIKNRITWGWIE